MWSISGPFWGFLVIKMRSIFNLENYPCVSGLMPRVTRGLGFRGLPRGSYSTPFLGRLLFKITDPNHKTRYPKKGVGYEPLGRVWG